mmetsp:Transcript_15625/g.33900  ORF Transcript_15625/g.33900 Transcript_15625/m.33900 type:complete len:312 (-) Transcript_15625:821-1756(-)
MHVANLASPLHFCGAHSCAQPRVYSLSRLLLYATHPKPLCCGIFTIALPRLHPDSRDGHGLACDACDRLAAVGLEEARDKVAMFALRHLEVVLVNLCASVHEHLNRLERCRRGCELKRRLTASDGRVIGRLPAAGEQFWVCAVVEKLPDELGISRLGRLVKRAEVAHEPPPQEVVAVVVDDQQAEAEIWIVTSPAFMRDEPEVSCEGDTPLSQVQLVRMSNVAAERVPADCKVAFMTFEATSEYRQHVALESLPVHLGWNAQPVLAVVAHVQEERTLPWSSTAFLGLHLPPHEIDLTTSINLHPALLLVRC